MKVDILEIKKENKQRRAIMDAEYDPVRGINTIHNMKEFSIDEDNAIYMPEDLYREPWLQHVHSFGSLDNFLSRNNLQNQKSAFIQQLTRERIKYDFEFWAATCAKIPDKESENEVPFILNRPQRRMVARLEKMRKAGVPIRIIVVKARQWGGSTLIQLYIAWVQLFHKRNWNSAIIADVEPQSKHIRGMFNRLAQAHPPEVMNINLQPYEGLDKIRKIEDRGNIIGIGSAQKPDNLRTYSIHMAHMSEVGSWKKTEGRSGEDLAQAIRASILRKAMTMIALESTAKGTGTFFHREWQRAVNNESGYDPFFVSWFEIERYQEEIDDVTGFIDNMTQYDWFLWRLGATLEGINWYKNTKESENYSDLMMQQEFPSTADEAFQSTGSRVIPKEYILKHYPRVSEPEFKGEIHADDQKGYGAFHNIEFHENASGNLHIWIKPDRSVPVKNRYALFMDIGGRSSGSDWSVISVFDRYMLLHNGPIERVATWRGHMDQDLVAWKAAQLAAYYNNGILAVEINSLRKDKNTEGEHSMTVLDEIKDYYDNLFFRNDPQKVKDEFTRYGFHTNEQSKSMIINRYIAALRDDEIIERDRRALEEGDLFETKTDGTMGAVEGQHDDILITSAGVSWLALQYMEPPVLIRPKGRSRSKKYRNTIANF